MRRPPQNPPRAGTRWELGHFASNPIPGQGAQGAQDAAPAYPENNRGGGRVSEHPCRVLGGQLQQCLGVVARDTHEGNDTIALEQLRTVEGRPPGAVADSPNLSWGHRSPSPHPWLAPCTRGFRGEPAEPLTRLPRHLRGHLSVLARKPRLLRVEVLGLGLLAARHGARPESASPCEWPTSHRQFPELGN